MRFDRLLLPLFLVLALLFTQQGAVTHGIAHVLAEQSQDPSLPQHEHCDLCAVYAQVGSAIGSSPVLFDFAAAFEEVPALHSVTFHSFAFAAFAARAPPAAV